MTTLTAEKIYDYCEEYCAILRSSLIQWRINLHRNSIGKCDDDEYHMKKIDALVNGKDKAIPDYVINEGKKYNKIVMIDNQRSVHAFVNKENGDVYKAASWALHATMRTATSYRSMTKRRSLCGTPRPMKCSAR